MHTIEKPLRDHPAFAKMRNKKRRKVLKKMKRRGITHFLAVA